ncbi:Uncharacterised protein [Brucella anthropi]|nr:Uncharacterised protein [Brucella anthropi]
MFTGSAANLRTIVLTLAQNWPWGSGTIALPADADTLFLSRDTWLPEESIGSVLEYQMIRELTTWKYIVRR